MAPISSKNDRTNCTNSSSSVKYLILPLATCSTDPRHVAGAPSTSRGSNHTRTMNAEALSSSSTSWLSHPGMHGGRVATAPPLAIHPVLTGTFYQTGVTAVSRSRHKVITGGAGSAIRAICLARSAPSTGKRPRGCGFCPQRLSPSPASVPRRRLVPVHQAAHGLVDALQGARGLDQAVSHQVQLIQQLGDLRAVGLASDSLHIGLG